MVELNPIHPNSTQLAIARCRSLLLALARYRSLSLAKSERASEKRASERAHARLDFESFGRQSGPKLPFWRRFGWTCAPKCRFGVAVAPFWRRFGATWAPKWRPGVAVGLPLLAAFWLILSPQSISNLNVHLWPCDFAILL